MYIYVITYNKEQIPKGLKTFGITYPSTYCSKSIL